MTHAIDASLGLPPSPSREALRWIWTLTFTDLQRDTRIIDKGEVVAGFGQAMWVEEQGGPLDLFIFVDPDHRTNGIGTSLLSWGERLARALGAEGVRAEVPEATWRDMNSFAHVGSRRSDRRSRCRRRWGMERMFRRYPTA